MASFEQRNAEALFPIPYIKALFPIPKVSSLKKVDDSTTTAIVIDTKGMKMEKLIDQWIAEISVHLDSV